jgi:hypothetical protein
MTSKRGTGSGPRLFLRGRTWYAQAYDARGVRRTVTTRCTDRIAAAEFAARWERELMGLPPDGADGTQLFVIAGAAHSFVYFVQAGESGPIKIGRAQSPTFRLPNLQVGNHERLRLLAVVPGGPIMEAALHRYFGKGRLGGEWFKPTPRLVRLIAEISP